MQATPQLSTTPPLPGVVAVPALNAALQTIATEFSGDTDPAALSWPYAKWADTANGLIKRRNAAGTDWVVEGVLFVRPQQQYEPGSEPTTNLGDIWINGIGACRWNATLSKYTRIPMFNNVVEFSAGGTFTTDAYTTDILFEGVGGGGGGGRGGFNAATGGGGGGGGGAGSWALNRKLSVAPSTSYPITVGGAGAGGTVASAGGSTSIGALLTLPGGDPGASAGQGFGGSGGAGGGHNGTNGSPNTLDNPVGDGGAGGASLFGAGGQGGAGTSVSGSVGLNGVSAAAPGAGGGGGGGSRSSTAQSIGGNGAAGFVRIRY